MILCGHARAHLFSIDPIEENEAMGILNDLKYAVMVDPEEIDFIPDFYGRFPSFSENEPVYSRLFSESAE